MLEFSLLIPPKISLDEPPSNSSLEKAVSDNGENGVKSAEPVFSDTGAKSDGGVDSTLPQPVSGSPVPSKKSSSSSPSSSMKPVCRCISPKLPKSKLSFSASPSSTLLVVAPPNKALRLFCSSWLAWDTPSALRVAPTTPAPTTLSSTASTGVGLTGGIGGGVTVTLSGLVGSCVTSSSSSSSATSCLPRPPPNNLLKKPPFLAGFSFFLASFALTSALSREKYLAFNSKTGRVTKSLRI